MKRTPLSTLAALSFVLFTCGSAFAQPMHELTLEEALRAARAHAPELAQARAITDAARARVGIAGAPRLPQLGASAGYQLGTTNSPGNQTFDLHNNFNFGLTANQLVYDFGQASGQHAAAKARASAEGQNELSTALAIDLDVRLAYFNAGAARAQLGVADETLANQQRHLEQIRAFVEVGTRPPIDLAQARTDVASARLAVVRSLNAYAITRASLNSAMGIEAPVDFEVGKDLFPPVAGEDSSISDLITEAQKARPEFAALSEQARAQELNISAIEGSYGPTLGASATFSEGGRGLDQMAANWGAGVLLSWPFFQGGLTSARVQEARASLSGLRAQLDVLRKETRFAVEEARTAVHGARAALDVSDEVVSAARERLALAEGRYAAGVGNAIELGDAQLALSSALSQRVQADYELATARTRLYVALGRR